MPAILYCGFEISPLLRSLLKNYSVKGLVVVSGTVHDFMFSGLRIHYEADSVIIVASNFGKQLSSEAKYACWKLMGKLGVNVFPPVPEEMIALSIFRAGMTSKGVDYVSSFISLCDALAMDFTVLPISEDIPSVYVKFDGREARLLEFLLSKEEERKVEGARFNWEFKPSKQSINYLKDSDSILILPSDPVSILPLIKNDELCNMLRSWEGEITVVIPPVTPKVKGILQHLGIDFSPVGLAKLFDELTDKFIVDQSWSEVRKEIFSSMGVEVLLADLSPSALEAGIPKVILESFPFQKKRSVAIKDMVKVVKGITRIIKTEEGEGGEAPGGGEA